MEFINISGSDSSSFQETKCIICQNSTAERLVSTPNGCKRIREASSLHNDSVTKRIKLLPEDKSFSYHVSNQCYKKYTNVTLLRRQLNKEESPKPHFSSEDNNGPSGLGHSIPYDHFQTQLIPALSNMR